MPEFDLRALKAQLMERELEKTKFEIDKLTAEAAVAEVEARAALRREKNVLADPEYAGVYPFYGVVSHHAVAEAVQVLGAWSRRDPGKPFTIVFNSPGGSVFEGFALFDFLRQLQRDGHDITTKATGLAASMGGILLQAGGRRVMDERAMMMVHEIASFSHGKSSELRDEVKLIERLENTALDILAERSTLSKREIARRWKRKDWFLDAPEALSLGFIDKIE